MKISKKDIPAADIIAITADISAPDFADLIREQLRARDVSDIWRTSIELYDGGRRLDADDERSTIGDVLRDTPLYAAVALEDWDGDWDGAEWCWDEDAALEYARRGYAELKAQGVDEADITAKVYVWDVGNALAEESWNDSIDISEEA